MGIVQTARSPIMRPRYTASAIALFADDFESGTSGDALTGRGFDNTSGTVSTTHANSGTKSAKHSITLGADGSNYFGLSRAITPNLVQGDAIWIQAYVYYPIGWDFGNNGDAGLGGTAPRSKFLRVHTATTGGANKGYNDIYLWKESPTTTRWNWNKEINYAWAFDGLDGYAPGRPQAPYTTIVPGTWHKVEYYLKFHSVDASAIVRFWEDNVLSWEVTDLATLTTSTDIVDQWNFITYYNGGAPATQDMWTDDWKVYTSASPPTNHDASGNAFIG